MKISHTAASLIGSAASGLIRAIQSDTSILVPRSAVEERITALYTTLVKEFIEDEDSWERRPMPGKYDVYLEIRTANGTVSEYIIASADRTRELRIPASAVNCIDSFVGEA